jgi:serine/threonine-protein kinase
LPGSDAVLFTLASGDRWNEAQIVVQSLSSGARRVLIEGGRDARYVSTGHLVYARNGTLFAVPFDVGRREVTGGPVSLVENVGDAGDSSGAAHFSLSGDGTLVYVPSEVGAARTLVWVDRQGREEEVAAPPRPYSWVRVSPDGTQLAMEVQEPGNTDIWTFDVQRNTQTRLTFESESDRYPIWTPDGQRIVFASGWDLVWKAANGTGDIELLATGLDQPRPFAWSADGKRLVFDQGGPRGDLWLLPMEGERRPQSIIANEFNTTRPAVSPDGRWIAYESNESGGNGIFVQPFPNVNSGRWQVTSRGRNSLWSPGGRDLFYDTGGNALMVLPVDREREHAF